MAASRVTAAEPEGGYNAVMLRYGEFVPRLGDEIRQTVADLNAPVLAALTKANQANPALARKVIADRVHPLLSGHLVMAEQAAQVHKLTSRHDFRFC